MIKARAKWVEEGKTQASYFLNFEIQRFTNKTIPKLKRKREIETTDQTEILY